MTPAKLTPPPQRRDGERDVAHAADEADDGDRHTHDRVFSADEHSITLQEQRVPDRLRDEHDDEPRDEKAHDDVRPDHRPLLAILVAELVLAAPREQLVAPATAACHLLFVRLHATRRAELYRLAPVSNE